MRTVLIGFLAAYAGFMPGTSNAAPVDFTFTDTISSATTPGIAVGDTFTLHLFADNGGSTVNSQTWNLGDLSGFTIHAGSYSATYSKVFEFPPSGNFQTDAFGNVSFVEFFGTSGLSNNTDNFGSWTGDTVFGNAQFDDFNGKPNNISANGFDDASKWTVSAVSSVPTPEPASLTLLATGCVAFGGYRLSRRRRKAAESTPAG